MAGADFGLKLSINEILKNVDAFKLTFVQAAAAAVTATTLEMQTRATRQFTPGVPPKAKDRATNPKIGDFFDAENNLRPHRNTGALSRDIKQSKTSVSKDAIEGSIFTTNQTAAYAPSVEIGGRHSRPHPFMKPAGEGSAKTFNDGMKTIASRFK